MFDVVILGGGSGGYSCALRSAQLGLSVALIEQDKLGGTCLHRGCIPTKALLHAAELADNAREASKLGVHAQLNGIELPKVNEYRDGVVGRLYKGLQGLIKQDKIRYIEGTGRLIGHNAVEVNGERIEGKNIVLATGSYSRSQIAAPTPKGKVKRPTRSAISIDPTRAGSTPAWAGLREGPWVRKSSVSPGIPLPAMSRRRKRRTRRVIPMAAMQAPRKSVPVSRRLARSGWKRGDRKSTRLNSSHIPLSRMPSSA